jgi:hypothetical protein
MAKKSRRAQIVDHISSTWVLSAPPQRLLEVISNAAKSRLSLPQAAADELAESQHDAIRKDLELAIAASTVAGGMSRIEFNASSPDYLQGSCFIAPADEGTELAVAKRRRLHFDDYAVFLAELSWRDFEAACRGVLRVLGCADPTLTKGSGDQGVDFYGELRLEGRLSNVSDLPGVDGRMSLWMVGQAKQYQRTQVSTPDLRELVGSVQLARAGVSADSGIALAGFKPRFCDPVVYLFFTTGQISRDGHILLRESGVIGMDGEQLAVFLSDNEVGATNETFDRSKAEQWIADCHRD